MREMSWPLTQLPARENSTLYNAQVGRKENKEGRKEGRREGRLNRGANARAPGTGQRRRTGNAARAHLSSPADVGERANGSEASPLLSS